MGWDDYDSTDQKLLRTQDAYDELLQRIEKALSFATMTDGAHHKQWAIDQMVRALTGDDYEAWVREYESCGNPECADHGTGLEDEYCDEGYSWDVGIG